MWPAQRRLESHEASSEAYTHREQSRVECQFPMKEVRVKPLNEVMKGVRSLHHRWWRTVLATMEEELEWMWQQTKDQAPLQVNQEAAESGEQEWQQGPVVVRIEEQQVHAPQTNLPTGQSRRRQKKASARVRPLQAAQHSE